PLVEADLGVVVGVQLGEPRRQVLRQLAGPVNDRATVIGRVAADAWAEAVLLLARHDQRRVIRLVLVQVDDAVAVLVPPLLLGLQGFIHSVSAQPAVEVSVQPAEPHLSVCLDLGRIEWVATAIVAAAKVTTTEITAPGPASAEIARAAWPAARKAL